MDRTELSTTTTRHLSGIYAALYRRGYDTATLNEGTLAELLDRVVALCTADDMDGICLSCLEDAYGVEPDAERYACESCGARTVYGAETLLLMLAA